MSIRFLLIIGLLLSLGGSVQAQDSGRKFALLVGVNKYKHPNLTQLRYCENDVNELAQLLQNGGYQTTLLTGFEATKANIDARLVKVLSIVEPGDVVVVAFAGHGLQFSDDAYFCPVDGRPFVEETTGLIALGKIYKDMDRSYASVKVMLVDACRNDGGRGLRGANGDSAPRPPRGVAAFFSCAAGEFAHEVDQFRHGVFFHYVLEGLRGKARNAKGVVTLTSLVEYVSEEVPVAVRNIVKEGAVQSPNIKADLQGSSPILLTATSRFQEKRDSFPKEKVYDSEIERKKGNTLNYQRIGSVLRAGSTQTGHKLKLEGGWTYIIHLTSDSFDPYLRVNGPNGDELAADDDGGDGHNSRLEFTANETGEFWLMVSSSRPLATGSYALEIAEKRWLAERK